LKAAQENGTAPEIIFVNYAEIPSKAMLGNYTALDEYMSPEVWDDLSENVQEMVEVQGKHYVYPAFVEPYSMLFYSKSAFEEAGLDPNAPPKSWEEMYEYEEEADEGRALRNRNARGEGSRLGHVGISGDERGVPSQRQLGRRGRK